jgi:hypothetical protein
VAFGGKNWGTMELQANHCGPRGIVGTELRTQIKDPFVLSLFFVFSFDYQRLLLKAEQRSDVSTGGASFVSFAFAFSRLA